MPRSLSKSQIDKLGERLAAAPVPAYEDLEALEGLRTGDYARAKQDVVAILLSLGVRPGEELTTRLKTNATIIDKLRRGTSLSSMQDLAGVRVARRMTLAQQDELVAGVTGRLQQSWFRVVDRRMTPSAGYRAVHLVVRQEGCPVEIQVRTSLQHLWAQTYELLANLPEFGRGIRYGELPARDRTAGGHDTGRFVSAMMEFSEGIAYFERRSAGTGPQTPVELTVQRSLAKLLEQLREDP